MPDCQPFPLRGFPPGRTFSRQPPNPEFSRNRASRDEAGTSGGDAVIVPDLFLAINGGGDSPVA
jgi:hypothetical protein